MSLFGPSRQDIYNAVQAVSAKLSIVERAILMSESTTQQDLDNLATTLNGFVSGATTDLTSIQTSLEAISAALANGQPVDTANIDAAGAAVASVLASLDSVAAAASTVANPATPTA